MVTKPYILIVNNPCQAAHPAFVFHNFRVFQCLAGNHDSSHRGFELMGHVIDEIGLHFRDLFLPQNGINGISKNEDEHQQQSCRGNHGCPHIAQD
ncbi:hypothetical protein D3C86_1824310 [compost metagenome]